MSRYTEFYLNSASSVVKLDLLTISHPDFTQVFNMIRRMMQAAAILAMAMGCIGAVHAQATVGPEAANVVSLGAEGTTVTAISIPAAVLQFGAGNTWATVNTPALPFAANCYSACPAQVGPDPAPGLPKLLVAVEQAIPYTVTLSTGLVVPVPALASGASPIVTVGCALPTALPTGTAPTLPTIPSKPANCPPIAGGVAVAVDGQMAIVMTTVQPLYLQYCQGTVCNAPFQFIYQPLVIGPTATLGGPVGGSGTGTLYAIPGQGPTVVAVAPAPVATVTVPASK